MGVVVRRYIYFLILLIPTTLVSVLFCSRIPTFRSFLNVFRSCSGVTVICVSPGYTCPRTYIPRETRSREHISLKLHFLSVTVIYVSLRYVFPPTSDTSAPPDGWD